MKHPCVGLLAAVLMAGFSPALAQSSLPACNPTQYDQYLEKMTHLMQSYNLSLKAANVLAERAIKALESMVAAGCRDEPVRSGETCTKLGAEAELAQQAMKANGSDRATKHKALETFQRRQRFVTPAGKVCLVCKHGYQFDEGYFKC